MFTRLKNNPILKPNSKNKWEARKVYNAGCIFQNNSFHLFYRAVSHNWRSSIGYATSRDGVNFKKFGLPIIKPENNYEIQGVEDPRIAKVDDTYYLAYTGYDGKCARLCLATSGDLKKWRKHGPVFKNWSFIKAGGFIVPWDEARNKPPVQTAWSKAGAIFPEKISGKYLMLFGDSNIWFANSINGQAWQAQHRPFLKPRAGFFDSEHVEMGPPPIKTDKGWLVLYHGIDSAMIYRLGIAILDLNNPKKIIYRGDQPIFEPSAKYELEGIIDITRDNKPKVIFCCGAVAANGTLRIYYGAADKYVCTATAPLDELLKNSI